MAIGNFPFYNRPVPGGTKARTLTSAKASPYMIVVGDTAGSDANPDDVTPSTSAGQTGVCGVITDPQGDPNDSNQFPIAQTINVTEIGTIPVLLVAGAYAKGDTIIASATAGVGKVIGAEAKPYDVIGYFDDKPQTTVATTAMSVRLNLHRVPA